MSVHMDTRSSGRPSQKLILVEVEDTVVENLSGVFSRPGLFRVLVVE
jgi:hypothetical protein